ncbi:MAG: glycoside hydrolase N-terminal domain-containing protein, partial [Lachnospiraceae bacterium]|nr:glycoside hydrolase N-terminal domain-containing protein [Lachnospiraceae bacterium]
MLRTHSRSVSGRIFGSRIWSGKKRNRINPACRHNIEAVRGLISDGKVAEAERLANSVMAGTPPTQRRYKTMCDITL